MLRFLNKEIKIEFPRSGPIFVAVAILAIFSIISNIAKDSRYLGHYLLGLSIITFITGIGLAFSKKERERTKIRLTAELPDRAALINVPDADKIAQRRGYYLLVIGLGLFIIWANYFGLSSLAVGV